jgi:hypothetical protein
MAPPGAETPELPDEVDTVAPDHILEGLGADGWGRLWRVVAIC